MTDPLHDILVPTVAAICSRIDALPSAPGRRLVAIAGPPGAGKSTLAEAVTEALVAQGKAAVLMPMDGFHLDDRLLGPMGLLPRKGAPETFDFAGFRATLARIREEPSVYLPVFDRSREIAIAGAAVIRPETDLVVVEGNYLVLDEDPWRSLATLWDLSVFLDVPEAEVEKRIMDRWLGYGFAPEEAARKAHGNDIPNARRIRAALGKVDMVVSG